MYLTAFVGKLALFNFTFTSSFLLALFQLDEFVIDLDDFLLSASFIV
jgi:hypothetical protein